jgi:hypothetical protein
MHCFCIIFAIFGVKKKIADRLLGLMGQNAETYSSRSRLLLIVEGLVVVAILFFQYLILKIFLG